MAAKKQRKIVDYKPILEKELPDAWLEFTKEELDYLCKKDPVLAKVVETKGNIKRRRIPEPFTGLLHAIVSQQISNKARDAIWQKMVSALAPISAADFARLSTDDLRQCGIANRKARYMLGIARAFADEELTSPMLYEMGENETISCLTRFPGIGRWTAEMMLIFTFGNPNILSEKDLGLQKAICHLYGYKTFTQNRYFDHVRKYTPFATLASFYLWEVAGEI